MDSQERLGHGDERSVGWEIVKRGQTIVALGLPLGEGHLAAADAQIATADEKRVAGHLHPSLEVAVRAVPMAARDEDASVVDKPQVGAAAEGRVEVGVCEEDKERVWTRSGERAVLSVRVTKPPQKIDSG